MLQNDFGKIRQMLKNADIQWPCNPPIPLLGFYPREMKTSVQSQKRILTAAYLIEKKKKNLEEKEQTCFYLETDKQPFCIRHTYDDSAIKSVHCQPPRAKGKKHRACMPYDSFYMHPRRGGRGDAEECHGFVCSWLLDALAHLHTRARLCPANQSS